MGTGEEGEGKVDAGMGRDVVDDVAILGVDFADPIEFEDIG